MASYSQQQSLKILFRRKKEMGSICEVGGKGDETCIIRTAQQKKFVG